MRYSTAKKFFRKALKAEPNMQATDKYSATEMAILEEKYCGDLSCRTQHRMIKYLNNIVEQDLSRATRLQRAQQV